MMAYATVDDVQAGLIRTLSVREREVCSTLLDRAAGIIDSCNQDADADAKKDVSCMMVERAIGSSDTDGIPIGATQGNMSALGYQQGWMISNGAVGELYLTKLEKQRLGRGNRIGSYSPAQELAGVSSND